MTFKIERTSDWGFNENKPPCNNAVIGVERYERKERIIDEKGKRIFQITPRSRNIWTVEIDTLEELMALKKEVNEENFDVGLIIFDGENGIPEIEIYDGYRE